MRKGSGSMILQVAVDRMNEPQLVAMVRQLRQDVDIIEVGTSYIKEYGASVIRRLREQFPAVRLLADAKIIDEAVYEATLFYAAGADVITVMGTAAIDTIRNCICCAKEAGREVMIDLLEAPHSRIRMLAAFKEDVTYAIHLPKDTEGNLVQMVQEQVSLLGASAKIAAAGGIRVEQVCALWQAGVRYLIIGSGITHAQDPRQAARLFRKEMMRCEHNTADRIARSERCL